MNFVFIFAAIIASISTVDCPWTLKAPQKEVREYVNGVYWVEAENFADYGGWLLDTQFAHKMGSGYLLAAGVGKPQNPAVTTIKIAESGRYRVLVRAKDWEVVHHPGKFALEVNGVRVGKELGVSGRDWSWETVGEVELSAGNVELKLVDLSGYYARCDAIVLTRDFNLRIPDAGEALADMRAKCAGEKVGITDGGQYDVIVVGGGPAGVPAAISAARHGAKVLLVQDRPVLGGNISSELGVLLNGSACHAGCREGGIIEEAVLDKAYEAKGAKLSFSRVFAKLTAAEPKLTVVYNARVYQTEKRDNRITAVLAKDSLTGERTRYRAALFVDTTGDGWVGYFSGAEYMFGREGVKTFGESYAPDEADLTTMSGCLLGGYGKPRLVKVGKSSPYVTPDWVWPLPKGFYRKSDGLRFKWWLEHPGDLDDCNEPELARDSLVRIFFAYWGWMKNETPNKTIRELADKYELVSLPFMNGRREGMRLLGDYIFTEADAMSKRVSTDIVGHTGWPLDTHDPLGVNNPNSTGSWKKGSPSIPHPAGIPYRILYSKNIDNLMMAGRNVSCSHVGLGTLRVAATCAVMGQAVGTAAAGCVRTGKTPREYGRDCIGELQTELLKDDQYLPGMCLTIPLLDGAIACATSEHQNNIAANVLDGYARTLPNKDCKIKEFVRDTGFGYENEIGFGKSHEWISSPEQGLPQTITLTLKEPKDASEVRITFDSNFYITPIWVHHVVPTTLVREYTLEVSADGENWERIAEVKENRRRLAIHKFAKQKISALRVSVQNTYGDASARIFLIGLW